MRLLLLNQFYPPDVAPTGQVLHDVARMLAERGHDVHVVCSRRSYGVEARFAFQENLDGVRVHRVSALGFGRQGFGGRLADYISFGVLAALDALVRLLRPDLVVALTTPLFLGLVARAVARTRGTAHAQWAMDVYPHALAAHGWTRDGTLGFRMLESVARAQLRGAAFALALGPFMAKAIAPSVTGRTLLAWIPLWGLDEEAEPATAHRDFDSSRDLVLLYSGNMGLGHRMGEFLDAASRLGPSGPVWAFAGGGPRRLEVDAFARAHPDARIELLEYVPRERLREHLLRGDVHLVSLSHDWQGLIVPSKIQATFSVGRPALFVGPRGNEIAAWIEASGGGWIVGEGDVDGLIAAVEEARDPEERRRRGAAALAFAREHFDRRRNCAAICRLMEESLC